jgi:hypothetical protein
MEATHLIKKIRFIGALALLCTGLNAQEQAFSHNDFANWELVMADDSVPEEQLLKIEPNLLSLYGKDHPKGIFRSKENYQNYELTLEWRWLNTPGNGGLLLHCDPTVTRATWPKCLEVQLQHGRAGNFRKNGERIEVSLDRPNKKAFIPRLIDNVENPVGEWNHLQVLAAADRITVYINGNLVNDGERASTSSGFIALQLELADIQFRSMTLKPLPQENVE